MIHNGTIFVDCNFDDYVLYPNSFMTITPKYYTKHYFAGAERIASAVGGGGFSCMTTPIVSLTNEEEYWNNRLGNRLLNYPQGQSSDGENVDIHDTIQTYLQFHDARIELNEFSVDYKSGDELCYLLNDEWYKQTYDDEVYYYHPDHLGGAAWITDVNGMPVQYVHYGPYGEMMENQQVTGYDERFKFTGKERDEETGYDYFGARYYLPDYSIFGSVDPLTDMNIELSSYMYCEGNPIKYVDPDGRFATFAPIALSWLAAAKVTEKYGYNNNLKTAAYAYQQPYVAMRVGIVIKGHNHIPWISTYASNFEINLIGNSAQLPTGNAGDYGNAFRHTLWQAIITSLFGEIEARRIGYAHEDGITYNTKIRIFKNEEYADCIADLLNNEIGRQIGLDNIGASNNAMAEKVLNYYKDKGLWVTEKLSNGQYVVKKVFLTQEQYNAALDKLKCLHNNGLEN